MTMSARTIRGTFALAATTAALVLFAGVTVAQASLAPVKLVQTDHFTAGFEYGHGVAVNNDSASAEHGDVYVVDQAHSRVQVFSPAGVFVEMFGREVNSGAPKDICKAGEACNPAGVGGSEAGQFDVPLGIAIDPSSGDVYVDEFTEEGGRRVQAFTAEGRFLFEIGREVNPTAAQKNVCAQAEIEKGTTCVPPKETPEGSTEEGAFRFGDAADLLAVGGPKDTLFVGDENHVQELDATTGAPAGQVSLTSIGAGQVQALALDQASGEMYVVYPEQSSDVIHAYTEGGSPTGSVTIRPRTQGQEVYIFGLALDPSGRLAVRESENGPRGSLYEVASGKRITGFTVPGGRGGMTFDDQGDLYAGAEGGGEVFVYTPEPIGELTATIAPCNAGAANGSSATFDCTLGGEANTEGVSETEAFFQWGRTTALGNTTPLQSITATGPVQAQVSGLRPNETYHYALAGYDANVKPPEEPFTSETTTLQTPTVAPAIAGSPSTLGVRAASATLFGELNPENATTEYFFEYAPGEALARCPSGVRSKEQDCQDVRSTPVTMSSVYGQIGTTAEITGLQPATPYDYRLFAEDESRANPTERFPIIGPASTLETPAPPNPTAQTGGHTTETATSATIAGTVNPDGQPAGYAFELGVYNGAETQFTIVQSGSAGSGSEPVGEEMTLTGLQPGTTYAYRIAVTSSYVPNEAHSLPGATQTFTTAGIPAVLATPAALPFLATPSIAFPGEASPASTPRAVKCKKAYKRNKHGKCVRVKKRTAARKRRAGRGH